MCKPKEAPLTTPIPRRILLVDLDGTLTDPAKGIVGCFRLALAALGRPAPPSADLAWIIGPPLRRSFAEMLGGGADAEEALDIYRAETSTTPACSVSPPTALGPPLGNERRDPR